METARTPDTIDLTQTITYLIRLLIQNLRSIVIITILALTCGGLYFWLSPKTFESKMIIQSDILSESYLLRVAENLNTHIHDKDIDYLVSKLNLTEAEAKKLTEFKIISALTPMSQQMSEKEKIIVVITVRVSDNSILAKLQSGIIYYLSSNEYIKLRVEENKKEIRKNIASLDREINMLDTLKIKISHGKFSSLKVGDVMMIDLAGLYSLSIGLNEKKHAQLHALAQVDSIQLIEDLSPYQKPIAPKLSITLLVSLLLAGIGNICFIFYKSIRNQIIIPGS